MREEGSVDRQARFNHALLLVLFLGYCAVVVYLIVNPHTRIIGVLNVALVGYLIPRWILPIVMDDVPYLWRNLVYAGWHGRYRAFEDRRVRVLDGERHTPSRIFATDIFKILGQSPSRLELEKLAARYGTGFEKGTEGLAEDEWLFMDEACLAYVRGHQAMKLALWLEREVFMPIDNRRSAETGKTYAFTREMTRQ